MESPNSSHIKSAHIPLTGPRDQSSNEAPGLPVALSNIAGVTKMPVPGGRSLSTKSIKQNWKLHTNSSVYHSAEHGPEAKLLRLRDIQDE